MSQFKSERGKKTLYGKYVARVERSNRKAKALDNVPFVGVMIDQVTVKRHRYLREHGLKHSANVANVLIRRTVKDTAILPFGF